MTAKVITQNSNFPSICPIAVIRVDLQVDTVQVCGVWSAWVIISCDADLGADYLESPVYPQPATHPPKSCPFQSPLAPRTNSHLAAVFKSH